MSNNRNNDNSSAMREALKSLLSAIFDYHENAIEYIGKDIMQVLAGPINRAQYALCEDGGSAPGNAAALLEALLKASDVLTEAVHHNLTEEYINDCLTLIHDALDAPPRNCDRFDDEQDAQLAFLNEEWLIFVEKDSMLERDRFENWTDEMRSAYARWLMAKARVAITDEVSDA